MIYTFKNHQIIKSDFNTVWEFFNDPKHINVLTPPEMKFLTLTKNLPKQIHENLEISYNVSPLFGIPLKWKTKITTVVPNESFIDIQIKGPYNMWHHLHTFEQVAEGVLMKDEVTYKMPLGIIGRLVHKILVKNKIEELFAYRTQQIKKCIENE